MHLDKENLVRREGGDWSTLSERCKGDYTDGSREALEYNKEENHDGHIWSCNVPDLASQECESIPGSKCKYGAS